jgi:hypothetical protein
MARYFVDYFVSFGVVARETFGSRTSMRLFIRHAIPYSSLIAWGPLTSNPGSENVDRD